MPVQQDGSGSTTGEQAAFAVPKQCADMISADSGRPIMFWRRDGLSRGVSALPASYGRPIIVLLWMSNETDQPMYTSSCGLADWIDDFSLTDTSGRRVLNRDQDYVVRAGLDPSEANVTRTAVCTATVSVEIPAKTCMRGQVSNSKGHYDFVKDMMAWDIARLYEIAPGDYKLVSGMRAGIPAGAPVELPFTVEAWGSVDRLLHVSTLVSYLNQTFTQYFPRSMRELGLSVPDVDKLDPLIATQRKQF